MSAAARRIATRKVVPERRRRPAVARDVMEEEQQHVLALGQLEQMGPQRHLDRKVETLLRRARESVRESGFGGGLDEERHPRGVRLKYPLPWHPKRVGEDGAQALVTRDQVAERSLQRGAVKVAGEPQRHRDRIGRARPVQTINEPESALRKRQWD